MRVLDRFLTRAVARVDRLVILIIIVYILLCPSLSPLVKHLFVHV
jgi:hypothetical protein